MNVKKRERERRKREERGKREEREKKKERGTEEIKMMKMIYKTLTNSTDDF